MVTPDATDFSNVADLMLLNMMMLSVTGLPATDWLYDDNYPR